VAKGGNYERQVCKELSLWWTNGERDDIFWRTAGSGGRSTARRKKKKSTANAAGDIRYDDALGKPFIDYFLCEIKRGYTSRGRLNVNTLKSTLRAVKEGKYTDPEAYKAVTKILNKTKKSGAIIDPLDLIDSKQTEPILVEWINKAEKEKDESKRAEIIILFKRDLKNACVLCSDTLIDTLENELGGYPEITLDIMVNGKWYNILLAEPFFNWANSETIVYLQEQRGNK